MDKEPELPSMAFEVIRIREATPLELEAMKAAIPFFRAYPGLRVIIPIKPG